MPPAITWFDLVTGMCVHYEMVPTPAPVPMPFPHPFVALTGDPGAALVDEAIGRMISLAMGQGATPSSGRVLINRVPAMITGEFSKNSRLLPHTILPPGTAWAPFPYAPKPKIGVKGKLPAPDPPGVPPGDAVHAHGSQTVTIMGSSPVRAADPGLNCFQPARLPMSMAMPIPKGAPVVIGGPTGLNPQLANGQFLATKALGRLVRTRFVANRLHKLVSRYSPARLRTLLHKSVCFFTGHPVNVANGAVSTEATDFELPGPIPLALVREYSSAFAERPGLFGRGWSTAFDQAVWLEPGTIVYRAEDGREIEFDTFEQPGHTLPVKGAIFDPVSRFAIRRTGPAEWRVTTPEGLVHELKRLPGETAQDRAGYARIVRTTDRAGEIELRYGWDERGRLEWAKDTAGREVRFQHDKKGRPVGVFLPHPFARDEWQLHTRYVYSDDDDLIAVEDARARPIRYEYFNHLLVQETDRNGLSFYFEYDGIDADARCTRTWGDGGIYDHLIDYSPQTRKTFVTNSRNETTIYTMNEGGAVVEIMDPYGGKKVFEHDEDLRKVRETDPLGYSLAYQYDHRGNVTAVIDPDNNVQVTKYHRQHSTPNLFVNESGDDWFLTYDEKARIKSLADPLGHRTEYRWSEGRLECVVAPGGYRVLFTYDRRKNLSKITIAPLAADKPPVDLVRYETDRRGRVTAEFDASGGWRRFFFDDVGNLARIEESSGNVTEFTYDAAGNVLEIRDKARTVKWTYTGFNWIASREEAEGDVVQFEHDTEGDLKLITNAHGHFHEFFRDEGGRVRREVTFDGTERLFKHDKASRVVQIKVTGGTTTVLTLNWRGQPTKVEYSDGTVEEYAYDGTGALIEAKNETTTVTLTRDALGRVVRERQGEFEVETTYDARGDIARITSSLGAYQEIRRDCLGAAEAVRFGPGHLAPAVAFTRDARGLEVERRLPGGVTATRRYDQGARLTSLHVRGPGDHWFQENVWDAGDLLRASIDSRFGSVDYRHDGRGHLAAAIYPKGEVQYRVPDAAGNVFGTPERNDRRYVAGGRIRSHRGASYLYDGDGNRSSRIDRDGRRWDHSWNGPGYLTRILRPDGPEVSCAYDPFGRRATKKAGEEMIRYVWAGEHLLHELRAEAPLVTWYFEPDSFAPMAKLEGNRLFSIVTDHLWTPTASYDDQGRLVWVSTLDVYGMPRAVPEDFARSVTEEFECPWRWPGQYEDSETGLYYNRFRYYDPITGSYASRDPLGLRGGLRPYGYVRDPTVASDPRGLIVLVQVGPVKIEAFPGPPAGGIEHLPLHVHIREGEEKTRVLMEDWVDNNRLKGSAGEVYPGDASLTKRMKKALKGRFAYLERNARSVFHTGKKCDE